MTTRHFSSLSVPTVHKHPIVAKEDIFAPEKPIFHGQMSGGNAPRAPFWPIFAYFYSYPPLFTALANFIKNKAILLFY
jgi:hypothetical protein